MKRKIVLIDESRCNGCGDCVSACAEGAIQLVDGKARLVSDVYCDGLGACIGECPEGAITIEEREAASFDESAAERHVASLGAGRVAGGGHAGHAGHAGHGHSECGCPGSAAQSLDPLPVRHAGHGHGHGAETPSRLANWPVQIRLAPVRAPYFAGASILVAADCTAFSHGGFHDRFIAGRTLLVGCPKLDDAAFYEGKLAEIFRENDVRSVEVAIMEVPCCNGLVQLVHGAIVASGRQIPFGVTRIGIRGDVLDPGGLPAGISRGRHRT